MFPLFSHHGVLGMNARNLLYIKPFNPRKAVAFADDKLKTKAFLAARGIPVAKIYARIETREQLRQFDFSSLPDECVLKPNYGFGGQGIIILKGRKNGLFLEQGKEPIPEKRLIQHIEDILDGKFSVNGRTDTAFFEKILVPHDCFAPFRPMGLPDIRIVVFNLVPVMAMLRVPTHESGGKANVHMGGIGIGIDIAKGVTTHAAQYNRIIRELPHGGSPAGFEIPGWENLLLISSRIQSITNIGYLAVDLTIDEEQGPVLLEVNARAGLMVQVANLAPLRARLERVEGLPVSSPDKGVRVAQDLFGEKRQKKEEKTQTDERPILGTREVITVAGDGVTIQVPCLIDPEEEWTTFTPELLKELTETASIEPEQGQEKSFRVKFTLGGKKIQTLVHEGEVPLSSARAIIGKRDLSGFLIDPLKEAESSLVGVAVKEDLRVLDKVLAQADHDLLLLKYLKPTNLTEERARLEKDVHYNPTFLYQKMPFELDDMEKRLTQLRTDESPMGILFEKKRRELLMRIALLRSRGNSIQFTQASRALFGSPSVSLIAAASTALKAQIACDLPPGKEDRLSSEDAVPLLKAALQRYGLHDWNVSVRTSLIADCTVGSGHVYLRAGAEFSKEHLEALIAHEIETHALTQVNGNHQPLELLRRGTANYIDTQEGLAIYLQNRVLSPYHEKRFRPARRVLATAFALGHSFADTRRYLQSELGYMPEKALTQTLDLKRGISQTSEPGAFTRALVYFRGLQGIEQFVREGGDLRRLFVGKVSLEDLQLIDQIPGVRPPLVLPVFLRHQETEKKKKKG